VGWRKLIAGGNVKTRSFGNALGALAFLQFAGCKSTSAPTDAVLLQVESMNAPATVSAGAPVNLQLNVDVGGCLAFDHIQSVVMGSQTVVRVWGKDIRTDPNIGYLCPRILVEQHTYQLQPRSAPTITIVVAEPAGVSDLTATVTVQ
jgi:hypothetical protein